MNEAKLRREYLPVVKRLGGRCEASSRLFHRRPSPAIGPQPRYRAPTATSNV